MNILKYLLLLACLFLFICPLHLLAQSGTKHETAELDFTWNKLVRIEASQAVTSVAIESTAAVPLTGIAVIADKDTMYFRADMGEGEDAQPSFSNLVIFRQPRQEISLYSESPVKGIRLHMLYAPQLKMSAATSKPRYKASGCEKPFTVDQSIWRAGLAAPTVFPTPTQVKHVIVHHTATANSDMDYVNTLRNIYLYHTQVQGYDDIAYNYLIAPDGTIFDGRDGQGAYDDDNVKGAHLCAKNSNTMGISIIGTYSDTFPPDTALASLRQLISWKLNKENLSAFDSSLHPIGSQDAIYLGDIAGHRDACPTECPGDSLYSLLTALRNDVFLLNQNCTPPTAIAENTERQWIIAPQPAMDYISIRSGDGVASAYDYTLMDISGRTIREGKIGTADPRINLKDLKKGCYVLRLNTKESACRFKVFKQ